MSAARVLMIGTDPASKGGISSVINMYAEGGLLDKIDFMASYTDGGIPRKIGFYLQFLARFIGALITRPQLRVIHIHTASYGSFTRKSLVILLSRLFGKRVILHVHGAEFNVFYGKCAPPARWLIRRLLRMCHVIIALSRKWKEDLFAISGNPDIRVLYNPTVMQPPVDLNGQEDVNFLFMGRLGKRKGVYDIIESARHIRSGKVKIRLYGDGELEQVKNMVDATGVYDKISVCGWISGEQKDAVFRDADVLILPSYNEGLPISILEAMAYGMPVVATDVGGIAEAVEDGVNGYLIRPGEPDRLARCIESLAESTPLREKMGASSHALALQKFALPVIIQQLETLYDEQLDPD